MSRPCPHTITSILTKFERVGGIGPPSQPWEGRVLPLNHTRRTILVWCGEGRSHTAIVLHSQNYARCVLCFMLHVLCPMITCHHLFGFDQNDSSPTDELRLSGIWLWLFLSIIITVCSPGSCKFSFFWLLFPSNFHL